AKHCQKHFKKKYKLYLKSTFSFSFTSRLGSDINEAESCMPERPVVLVVLHHTFQKDYMTPRSRGIVQKLNVVLAVDMLFHNGALLDCAQNHLAWDELSQFIRVKQLLLTDQENSNNNIKANAPHQHTMYTTHSLYRQL
uniref:Uncharacterized protein n=1 Tax=Periophthalmus magnuspinnatus TaxID=409849 RepID=A0A3B4AK05_9GOBI